MSPWMLNVKADVTKAMQLQMNNRRVLIIPVSQSRAFASKVSKPGFLTLAVGGP
jgi:hypothetical protein